jgi:hypothetical protein
VARPAPDFSNQVHGFNLGFDNGLFWTVPVDRDSVKVEPSSGKNSATMAWSVESAGKAYLSGPEETSSSVSAQVGHERNGVFFAQ